MADLETKFAALGLDAKNVELVIKSKKVAKNLSLIADLAGGSATTVQGKLLQTLAGKISAAYDEGAVKNMVDAILDGRLASAAQVGAAAKYGKKKTAATWDNDAFEKNCGVGVTWTDAQIEAKIQSIIDENKDELVDQRYFLVPRLMKEVNSACAWADGRVIHSTYTRLIEALLGPKTEEDMKRSKPKSGKKDKSGKKGNKKGLNKAAQAPEDEGPDELSGREIPDAVNTPEQLATREAKSGGGVITRFPPEPNGFLHIGHAKAMNFNFGVAKERKGKCIMRFDDTNPAAEKQLYIDNILENVTWMGHEPCQVTYSSDYFQELYDLAVKLIKKDLAYVCHQTKAEIDACRQSKTDSPYRTRSIEENLKLFEDMKKGKFDEGAATLRMKGDMNHPNPQFWDIVAYRIIYKPHPHAGNGWCIYPSYDFTHCIVDSLEWISHSLCTLEFEVRRESYFWLLNVLDLYKPKVWEYSRLNIDNNVLSKRRLLRLVNEGHVRGWDDPRLLTINGLRRRGYTAAAITDFVNKCGVTRNKNSIPYSRLENSIRSELNVSAVRAMAIHNPLKVILTNWDDKKVEQIDVPNFPQDASKGTHQVPLSKVVYIERGDFKLEDSRKYFGLAPNKTVHLKHAYNITCDRYERDSDGKVNTLFCSIDTDNKVKCKGQLTWVAEPAPGTDPAKCEIRLYNLLFQSKEPMALPSHIDWITDLNPDSEVVITGFVDPSATGKAPGTHVQFERQGYYVVDTDTSDDLIVFNRTCELRSSKEK